MRSKILMFFFVSSFAFSIEWPGSYQNVNVFFGQFYTNNFSHLSSGLIFNSNYPVDIAIPGELVFYYDSKRSVIPYFKDSSSIIYNGDGLYSCYMGLSVAEDSGFLSEFTELGVPISDIYYMEFYDTNKKMVMNPLLLLPRIPVNAKPKAVVESFSIVSDDGREIILDKYKDNFLPIGTWKMRLKAYYVSDNIKLPWYKISVFLEGLEIAYFEMSSVFIFAGNMSVVSSRPSDEIFDSAGNFILGEFRFLPGKQSLKIVLEDINGSVDYQYYSLIVK
ncbi:hypothetical protein WKV44_09040 [Spirochaetia bacterium 38H-sp]|uniref:Uncharacterized protein n=1 Tax=Rarispira pelagica TaxID=3141764 RepID=A0ABU9UDD8_9SPIR